MVYLLRAFVGKINILEKRNELWEKINTKPTSDSSTVKMSLV